MNKNNGKKPFPWKCSKCQEKAVYDGTMNYSTDLEFDNRVYRIKIPKLKTPRCRKCGAPIIDSEADEHITAEFLRLAKLLTPDKIRKYRERLGISQKDLASAIGIVEKEVARYESGRQFQQRPVDNMLRLFFGLPEARDLLTKRKLSRVGLVTNSPAKAAS